MAVKANYSLSTFKAGAVGADGGMGASLTQVDDPVRDTCVITQADPTNTPFPQEISDQDYFSVDVPGDKTLAVDFYAKTPAQLAKICGGTVTPGADGAPDSWEPPASQDAIEQSYELTHKSGSKVQLPRVSVNYTFEWKFQRTGLPLVHMTGKILDPVDPDTGEPLTTAKWMKFIAAPTA